MELAVHARVYCTDGHVGDVEGLIVDPSGKRVTHVIVQRKVVARTEYLVPLDWIVEGTAETTRLSRTRQQVEAIKPFVESGYEGDAIGRFVMAIGTSLLPDGFYEGMPGGELEIHRYARVEAHGRHVGRVDAFVVDPANGHISALVLREGHLWGHQDVIIPAAAIDRLANDAISLALDKGAVAALPRTRDTTTAGPGERAPSAGTESSPIAQ
jgi:sporulation protein YlmC with PRC-barrel domain